MYIVSKVFDDGFIELTNLSDFTRKDLSLIDQKKIGSTEDILGLCVINNKVCYVNAYSFLRFISDEEARLYCKENNVSYNNVKYIDNMWFLFIKENKIEHVSYYVYTETEVERKYIGPKNSYTPYKQAAKEFEKEDAYIKARMMTKNSKTGKRWYVLREYNHFY